jgi:hypothetical protein
MALFNASRAEIHAAREWVEECSWKEDPEDIAEMTDDEIVRGVDKHYEGGWRQFREDCA